MFRQTGRLRSLLWLVVFIGAALVPEYGLAEEEEEQTKVPTVSPLLVLLAASDDTAIALERTLVAELRLTLDGVPVEQIAIERSDFLTITLPEQLEVVQPLIRRFLAKAAVWITAGGTSGHLIQFVVSESGSATVRTVEAGSPEELALAVRELLDSTYLFDVKKKKEEHPKTLSRLSIAPQVGLNGGMENYEGGPFYGGFGLELRLRIAKGFFGGVTCAGKLGPRLVVKEEGIDREGILLGWRIEVGGFLTYMFRIGRFGAGPYVHLAGLRSTVNSVLGLGYAETNNWWAFRGAAGLELFVEISEIFGLILDWTVGGITNTRKFKRRNTQPILLETPRVDYSFMLGFSTTVL